LNFSALFGEPYNFFRFVDSFVAPENSDVVLCGRLLSASGFVYADVFRAFEIRHIRMPYLDRFDEQRCASPDFPNHSIRFLELPILFDLLQKAATEGKPDSDFAE